jgi:L-asparaginase
VDKELPRIAVFAGPNATILNTPPLVTSGGAAAGGCQALRPQRLAAPVTVYIDQFSAHPMEADAAHLYAQADGWLDTQGTLHPGPVPGARPVYRVELRPEDGPYLLPYVARQHDGTEWSDATSHTGAGFENARQTFYPDASWLYHHIDRFGVAPDGSSGALSRMAGFKFFRALPPAGYMNPPSGAGKPAPEVPGEDFFPYFPYHLQARPAASHLAAATNLVQRALAGGRFDGAQWLESSTTIEETLYWLSLLVDTEVPIVGHSAQQPHLATGYDGARNIIDGVRYIASRQWSAPASPTRPAPGALGEPVPAPSWRDILGPVLVADGQAIAARELAKVDARAGGNVATGGHGGVVATVGVRVRATFAPLRCHTWSSEVNLSKLPRQVAGTRLAAGRPTRVEVDVLSPEGDLLPWSMPCVRVEKYVAYPAKRPGVPVEVSLEAMAADCLAHHPLAGIVAEGSTPYAEMAPTADRVLERAVLSGVAVVKVGRGYPAGDAHRRNPLFVAGSNLSANKARLLLMACLLKLGAPPPALDPAGPTQAELAAARAHIDAYQEIFDTH